MKHLNHSELYEVLSWLYEAKLAPFIWGTFGIGKSSIVRQFAHAMDLEFIDLRMSQIEGIDLRGIPYATEEGVVKWMSPSMFVRRKTNKNGQPQGKLIFLDELNTAMPMTQSAAYQLILDRCLGEEIVLADNDFIVAAGNLDSDGAATFDVVSPLANRFFNIILENSSSKFLENAELINTHASVIGYITQNPGELHTYNPDVKDLINGTNRTWTMLSTLIKAYTKLGKELTKDSLTIMCSGLIPETVGTKFIKYFMDGQMFPSFESILAGKPDRPLKKELAAASISFTIAAAQFLNDAENKRDPVKAEKITKFILEAKSDLIYADSKIAYCRTLLRSNPYLVDLKAAEAKEGKKSTIPSIIKLYEQFTEITKA